MTSRWTLALVVGAGFAVACGGSTGSDLFSSGGSGQTGGSGGSAASGGDGGTTSAGSGGVGNSGSGGDAGAGNAGSGGVGNAGSGGVGNAGSGGVGNAGSGGAATGGATTGGMGGTGGVVRGDPGIITCNQKDCHVDQGNWCCDPWYFAADPVCIPKNQDCDNNPGSDAKTDIVCDGPEDCPMGSHCCGSLVQFQGGATRYDDIVCKPSCGANEVVICGDFPEECSTGTCSQSGVLESGYNVCRD